MNELDDVTKSVIDSLKGYPENFKWTPSLSVEPIGKEELIEALKNGSEIGKMFLERIRHGTISRMVREAKKRDR